MRKRTAGFLFAGLISLTLVGCGNTQAPEETQEPTETVISVEKTERNMDILPSTKEELLTMSREDFKAMIEECIPDYRAFFKVSDDYVITEGDWDNFKELLSLHLFGSARLNTPPEEDDSVIHVDPTELSSQEPAEEQEIPVEVTEEETINEMVIEPTYEYILSLSDAELVEYLFESFEYWYPGESSVDFSLLTPEQLAQVREEILAECSEISNK